MAGFDENGWIEAAFVCQPVGKPEMGKQNYFFKCSLDADIFMLYIYFIFSFHL